MNIKPELSLEIANFAWEKAEIFCQNNHGCVDYHKVWSLVRLLLKDDELPIGQELWKILLESTAHLDENRYLISGGADTGLLISLWTAIKDLNLPGFFPKLVFSDQCKTPCAQVEFLSARLDAEIQTCVSNILDINETGFSGIVAHNFLLFFSHETRKNVISKWYDILTPGGALAIFQSVRREGILDAKLNSEENINRRVVEIKNKALEHGFTPSAINDLTQSIIKFWNLPEKITSRPTFDQLMGEFYEAGFKNVSVYPIVLGEGSKSPITLASNLTTTSYGFIAQK